jgi:hypothetical protein
LGLKLFGSVSWTPPFLGFKLHSIPVDTFTLLAPEFLMLLLHHEVKLSGHHSSFFPFG